MAAKSTKKTQTSRDDIGPTLIAEVCERLSRNQPVRRTLPGKGRLHIDRQLPFLCVYCRPAEGDSVGTERLVKGEPSYLVASGEPIHQQGVSELLREVVRTLSAEFGAFLIVEVRVAPDGGPANDAADPTVPPEFRIDAPPAAALSSTVEMLERQLSRIKVLKQSVEVRVVRKGAAVPPLVTESEARDWKCSTLVLTVPPVYRRPNSREEFPLLIGSIRRSLSLALRKAYFEFVHCCTTQRPTHYHELGRKAVVKAVWEVDRQLAVVSNQFDYLLQLTPVNTNDAWRRFEHDRFERTPEFHYRPLPVDPTVLKRDLYRIPIERVEDPALQRIFQEKQHELELQLSMLRDRDTPRFLYGSLQLFGGVENELLQLARGILEHREEAAASDTDPQVDAQAFAERAEDELDFYRQACPDFKARVLIKSDVSGLIVSRGRLFISADLCLPASRVDALLAHEVGTHLVTYYNGRLQPLQQLYSGLAGYEELQEGLAVLSEFLVGGLTRNRMRQLAARVVAVRQMIDGASFVDVFRTLDRDFGFTQRTAYKTTMRVFRGGGLTKDAVYLRGLQSILRYVQKGGELTPLYVGKLAVKHIPIVKELQYRDVLKPPAITPRYLRDAVAMQRLESLRDSDGSAADLISISGRTSGSQITRNDGPERKQETPVVKLAARRLEASEDHRLERRPGLFPHSSRKDGRMKIGFVVNDVMTEQASYTTTRLGCSAVNLGHEVYVFGVGDIAYDPDERIRARARSVSQKKYNSHENYLKDLQGQKAVQQRITVDDLDVLMLRNVPSDDYLTRPWASVAAAEFGRVAMRHGVIVVNDPNGLAKASSKMYFQLFPEEVRPRTLITRDRGELKDFAKTEGRCVLKPLQGSGGASVFLVQKADIPNLNQMIDAVSRDGFVIAQEYLPAAEDGDMRLFVMNGRPLQVKGKYAAFRRVRSGGDMRSNIHAGGKLAPATVTDADLKIAEIVRPKLVQDGMFLVGLDIVGNKLMEINVFSPGGLGSAQKFTKINFSNYVIGALERKANYMGFYGRNFGNVEMCTL